MASAVSNAVKSGVVVWSHPDTARKRYSRDANCFARVTEPGPEAATASATAGLAWDQAEADSDSGVNPSGSRVETVSFALVVFTNRHGQLRNRNCQCRASAGAAWTS